MTVTERDLEAEFNTKFPSHLLATLSQENPRSAVLAVQADEAARLCGIGRTLWYSLRSAGKIPKPIRLGRRTLWRVAELTDWLANGGPPVERWEQFKRDQQR